MRAGHVVWAAFLTAVGLGAGCAQVLGFDGDFHKADGGLGGSGTATTATSTGGGGSGGRSGGCANDAACDDGNPCTNDTCGSGSACVHTKVDGLPAPADAQTAGDCKRIDCVAGQPTQTGDDTDVPDDGNDCTDDACSGGAPSHMPAQAGMGCQDTAGHSGTCDGAGQCAVACTATADCTSSNPCVTPACDTTLGKCTFPPLPDGMPTPGAQQTPGDCHQHLCMGGVDTNVEDDTDTPPVQGDCATGMCNGGVGTAPSKQVDTPCATFMGSKPGFCDGSGACVECTQNGECPGTPTDCAHPACVSNACTTAFTTAGTATTTTPAQTPGDCQLVECDGAGGTIVKFDANDPKDDGNACTTDTCMPPSTTVHTDVANGTTCGVGGTLSCLNGMCSGCTMDTQCPAPSCTGTVLTFGQHCATGMCVAPSPATADCAPYVCSNGACGTKCNVDLDCALGNYCTGANGTCQAKLGQAALCSANHQCTSGFCTDGVCCNQSCGGVCQACTAAKKGAAGLDGICGNIKVGTDPDSECSDQGAVSCGTNGSCDGNGACQLYANGTTCAGASCANGTTLNSARTCNGTGTCSMATTLSCAPYLCASGACGTSCINDAGCASGFYCNTGVGQCVAKVAQGGLCTVNSQCQSAFCTDGVCCDQACTGTCQACTAAKKGQGADGTCGAIKAATDPDNECTQSPQTSCGQDGFCNGAGACEDWASGTQCVAAMCNGSTFTTARTCDGMGTCQPSAVGPCANHLACQNPTTCYTLCGSASGAGDSHCASGYYCDGVGGGACQAQKASGASCARNGECASGNCNGSLCM